MSDPNTSNKGTNGTTDDGSTGRDDGPTLRTERRTSDVIVNGDGTVTTDDGVQRPIPAKVFT